MSKNIIVTGATSGIGLELTKSLISKGHTVYAVGRSSEKYLLNIERWCSVQGFGGFSKWVEYDFTNLDGISAGELKKLPEFDGFVNSAGILPVSPLKLQKNKDIIEAFNINLIAPMLLTRDLLKSKRIVNGGAMIYLSSINGTKVGSKAHTVYSATKGGAFGLVMSLANEVSTLGIRVNAISPGTVESPMLDKTKGILGNEIYANYLKNYPLGIGSPSSVVSLIEFLLDKNLSSWITGQNFVIDGGYTLN